MTQRGGIKEAGQVGHFGLITGLGGGFDLDGVPFNIKNNTITTIDLIVVPAGGGGGDAVAMKCYPGWNVEIVSSIAINNDVADGDLSWGS
jgi:hypothetical protein